jgi:dTDP-4-dehydrorhamnose 3,5-epimerase
VGTTLDAESRTLLWIPEGFAHGYVVLSEVADVMYKVTAEYVAALDRGVRWDDPTIGIEWPVADPIVSAKDREQPTLEAAEKAFG